MKRFLPGIKLKHVWFFTIACVIYIIARQGWPSPALESIMVKAVEVWMGALIGFGIDSVHYYFAKPSEHDSTPVNMYRRTALIIAGMVAFSL